MIGVHIAPADGGHVYFDDDIRGIEDGRNGYVDDRDIEGLTELCDCAHHSCNIRSHVADRVVMKIEDGVSDSVVADTLQPSLLYTSLLS